MIEQGCSVVPPAQDRPRRRLFWRLLEWLLLGALLGALFGLCLCAHYVRDFYGRWSLFGLLYGLHFGCEGARIGTVIGAGWHVTRRSNVIGGVVAGVLLGLAVWLAASTIYLPLDFLIIRSPEPLLPTMQTAFLAGLADVPAKAYQSLLVVLFAACISYLRQRSAAQRAKDAEESPAEAAELSPS